MAKGTLKPSHAACSAPARAEKAIGHPHRAASTAALRGRFGSPFVCRFPSFAEVRFRKGPQQRREAVRHFSDNRRERLLWNYGRRADLLGRGFHCSQVRHYGIVSSPFITVCTCPATRTCVGLPRSIATATSIRLGWWTSIPCSITNHCLSGSRRLNPR